MDEIAVQAQRQQQEQRHAQEQAQVHEHLRQLQTWDDPQAEGALEQRRHDHARFLIERQRQYTQILNAQLQEELPPAYVNDFAAGEPQQLQAPAQETYKQRRERRRQERIAKSHHQCADGDSYRMLEDVKTKLQEQRNSIRTLPREIEEQIGHQVDRRVLQIYVHGYKAKRNGRAVDAQNERYQREDHQFIEDYASLDLERRKPHLDRIVEQVLAIRYTPDMLSMQYLTEHPGEMKQKADQYVYFQNVYNDPVNRPYFDALPELTRQLLEKQVLDRSALLGSTLGSAFGAKAVYLDLEEFYARETSVASIRQFDNIYNGLMQDVNMNYDLTENQIHTELRHEAERMVEAQKAGLLQESDELKTNQEVIDAGLGETDLTAFATLYSLEDVTNYRKKIEEHPEQYAQTRQLVDELYQGLYRAVDARGDITLRLVSIQNAIEQQREGHARLNATQRMLEQMLVKLQEETLPNQNAINGQIATYADALEHVLRAKALSAPAQQLLRDMGYAEN